MHIIVYFSSDSEKCVGDETKASGYDYWMEPNVDSLLYPRYTKYIGGI